MPSSTALKVRDASACIFSVCVRARVCVHACVCTCVRVRVRACAHATSVLSFVLYANLEPVLLCQKINDFNFCSF